VALAGIYLAWLMYGRKKVGRNWLSGRIPFVHRVLYRKYYIDELYDHTVVWVTSGLSHFLKFIDRFVIESLVELFTVLIRIIGGLVRRLQTGQVQTYGAVVLIGFVAVLIIMAVSGGYFR
jgi:NADH-quinone oxidoreductase subunit L